MLVQGMETRDIKRKKMAYVCMTLWPADSFHLIEAGDEREQNTIVLFRALHPLWSSAGESAVQFTPSPSQTLRPNLMPFQTDLNL